jgi:glycerol-3-phosphate dehydrogenase
MTSEVSQQQFDVIVVGAGINGAGIARDAAMRGLNVLLLDKGDIGSGTSSWSTRLIHGGLRYLEHGEFGLVRESLRERECLLKIAPHLIRQLRILVPIYKNARRGVWTVRAGMIAYDALSFDKTLPGHRMLSRAETLQEAPGLNPEDLLGAAVYLDAQVEFAERFVLENALSAIAHGATILTYARVDRFLIEEGMIRGVECTRVHDSGTTISEAMNSGTAGLISNKDRHSITGRVVINAAGPWVDQVLNESAVNSPRLIGGTKGSHIVVAPFAGTPETAIYVEAEADARPFFIIPWNRNYLIGTTDIRYDGDLDHVAIDNDEIAYLLRETNRVIPGAKLTREDILYSYSGVRPLPFTNDKDEQSITRKHFIRRHHEIENLFSIVGGKLTTYRSLSEQAVDLVVQKLQKRSMGCTTDRQPLPGAETPDFAAFSNDFKQRSGLTETISDRLLRIYGTRSSSILNLIGDEPSLAEVFDTETGAMAAEVVFAFKQELAQTLSDCLLRRSMVGLNSICGLNAVDAAARVAQSNLGWSRERVALETIAYKNEISRRFRR